MSKVHVCNVVVCNNPAPFLDNLQFEITFDCIETLSDDLQWKIIYVGSAETEDYDQTLEQVFVGPVYEGRHRFLFQANPPDTQKLPKKAEDVIGLTLIMLTCSYRSKEFIRIGYYVNVQYTEKELEDNPPEQPNFTKMQREIMADKSRVTKFPIKWEDAPNFHSSVVDNQTKRKTKKDILESPSKKSNKDVIDLELTSPTKNGKKTSKAKSTSENIVTETEEEVDEEEEKKKFLSSFLPSFQVSGDDTPEVKDAPKENEKPQEGDSPKDKEDTKTQDVSKANEVTKDKESEDNIEIIDDEPMIIDDDGENKDKNVASGITESKSSENKESNTLNKG